MFRRHVIGKLSIYHHGWLPAAEKAQVEEHLRTCAKCREAHEEIRFGASLASVLRESPAPELEWNQTFQRRPRLVRRWIPAVLLAGLAATITLIVFVSRRDIPAWQVTGLRGTSQLHPGEVLQTDSSSKAEIKIADIGQLVMDPNTRIRLLVTRSDQHRIALDRGKVEARTWAPPRLFIVDTPSATAIDLGCRYTLEVQEDGSSLLYVTLGLVAFEHKGRETVVPAGAFCRTRHGEAPGTPFFEDSSADFQAALAKVDSLTDGAERLRQLEIVLRGARVRDALSLWHLLAHLDATGRGLVYDRLAQLLPPPPEVTRDGIVSLDSKMLDAWKKVVSQLWQ